MNYTFSKETGFFICILQRGKDYEVRRYPETVIVEIPYTRRDEGYDLLGSVTSGMRQLAPAVMTVGENQKEMGWYIGYSLPGEFNYEVQNNTCMSYRTTNDTFILRGKCQGSK